MADATMTSWYLSNSKRSASSKSNPVPRPGLLPLTNLIRVYANAGKGINIHVVNKTLILMWVNSKNSSRNINLQIGRKLNINNKEELTRSALSWSLLYQKLHSFLPEKGIHQNQSHQVGHY